MSENIKIALPVTGMSCASCAISVETMLKTLPGIKKAAVNYGDRSVHVEFDNSATSLGSMRKAVQDIGYDLMIDLEDVQEKLEAIDRKQMKSMLFKLLVAIVCSLPILAISMLNHHITSADRWLMLALSLPVIFYSGSQFYITAWKQATHRSANMDTLVATGTGAAFLFSLVNTIAPQLLAQHGQPTHVYFESAAIIITFILTGRVLEEKAKHRASTAIKKLAGLQPKTITLRRNGEKMSVSPALVQPGDQMEVKPGDRIPADGKVVAGESYVDQSSITGEPVPAFKILDDKVFAGTLNQQGNLKIEATSLGSDSLLSHIIGLVQEAQSSKPPIQKLVDRIAAIFVPVVLIIGLITFVIWFFAGPEPTLNYALIAALSVLIIACPCALGLATPTALIVGLGRGASHGILVKDVSSLQQAYKVDTVIVDKTGTITIGKPLVSDITWFGSKSHRDLASIIYSLEKRSQHPLAESLCKYLAVEFPEIALTETELTGFVETRGAGVQAEISAKTYFSGNEAYMREMNVPIHQEAKVLISELKANARTLIFVGNSDELLTLIGMSDTLKPGAAEAVAEFNKMGIEVIMLTGDQPEAANFIAAQAGIHRVIAGALPHEKGDFIKKLQAENHTVAMIGDGINDSYALALADVGIAMAKGSDIALESAGITLMGSDLKQAVAAFRLSKAIIRKIRQNLFWAFVYNIIAIPLAAGVLFPLNGMLLSPMIAGAAMAMSSVSVVANSLRLLAVKI